MKKDKNILVLGYGFLGRAIADALTAEGYQVRVMDRAPKTDDIVAGNIEYVSGDYLNISELSRALDGMTTVYHCISTTHPRTGNLDPVGDVKGNLIGTIGLLEAMVKLSVPELIFCSSGGTVYGDHSRPTEISREDPICAYGINKLAIEKYIGMYQRNHGLKFQILRITNPYGIGQDYSKGQGVVTTFLHQIKRDKPIRIFGNDKISRDYIYVDDLTKIVLILLENDNWNEIYNIASGEVYSLGDICNVIEEVIGRSFVVDKSADRDSDLLFNAPDNSKLLQTIGSFSFTKLPEGIQKLDALMKV